MLAVPAWLYLWLGAETSPPRVLVFLAGYLLLGVALTNRREIDEGPVRPAGPDTRDRLEDHRRHTT